MLKLPALLLLTIFAVTEAGCQHPTPIVATSGADFCDIGRPISYSSRDTPETRAEILSHNAAGCAICGNHPVWKPKCTAQSGNVLDPTP